MLETSMLLENSATTVAGGAAVNQVVELRNDDGGGGGSVSGGSEEDERSRWELEDEKNNISGGNRWPHDEALALLKIRSQMDLAFRDSSLKGPLWDEISRKMGELGYSRNAKKYMEKFENIYKYHKRTKDSRSSRQTGKNYRFFEKLELLDNQINRMDTTTSISIPVPMPMPIRVCFILLCI